jgi:signal transduction histidine kinase
MRLPDGNSFNIGRRLTLTLALLIALILGGNGLVVWQFQQVRVETSRLTGVSQQLIAVLRLQQALLSFHQRLNELAESRDAQRLANESGSLRAALTAATRQTRSTLAYLPPDMRVDPAFLTALDTIQITLPEQLGDVTALASAGDWETVRLRLDNELERIENTTATHVRTLDRELDEELPRALGSMQSRQRRILLIVPATALSTVLVAALFGWAIARRILELRVEERVNERTRIAREIHDTLLQSFQAVLMKLYAATAMIPERPAEAQVRLGKAIEQARDALNEGRQAVLGLRASTAVANDLGQAFTALGQGLAAGKECAFRVHVEGTPRDLIPLVRDEVYRITSEALTNAFRHAQAERIEVELQYQHRQLRLRVRDNGKGIDPQILDGGRAGHFGLPGMQERARLVGGRLAVWSEAGFGTEIELRIPGSAAFAKPPDPRLPPASRTAAG